MPGRTYNLQSGRQKAVQVLGLKELEQNVNAKKTAVSSKKANSLMVDCAVLLYNQAGANLRSVNAPHEVAGDLFVYGRSQNAILYAEKQVTALTGLRKHGSKIPSRGYVEWLPGKQVGSNPKENRSRRKRGRLVLPGTKSAKGTGLQKIGENLGTMWELGTTKLSAKPWWKPAVMAVRGAIFSRMADGLREIIGT